MRHRFRVAAVLWRNTRHFGCGTDREHVGGTFCRQVTHSEQPVFGYFLADLALCLRGKEKRQPRIAHFEVVLDRYTPAQVLKQHCTIGGILRSSFAELFDPALHLSVTDSAACAASAPAAVKVRVGGHRRDERVELGDGESARGRQQRRSRRLAEHIRRVRAVTGSEQPLRFGAEPIDVRGALALRQRPEVDLNVDTPRAKKSVVDRRAAVCASDDEQVRLGARAAEQVHEHRQDVVAKLLRVLARLPLRHQRVDLVDHHRAHVCWPPISRARLLHDELLGLAVQPAIELCRNALPNHHDARLLAHILRQCRLSGSRRPPQQKPARSLERRANWPLHRPRR
mmetsp:Transcript_31835/g.77933  ORF Transcript_31835/g.77933 Transcript_31835/m.77933 type:complete len:341 (-) Transcript_31835:420-1442(-)